MISYLEQPNVVFPRSLCPIALQIRFVPAYVATVREQSTLQFKGFFFFFFWLLGVRKN